MTVRYANTFPNGTFIMLIMLATMVPVSAAGNNYQTASTTFKLLAYNANGNGGTHEVGSAKVTIYATTSKTGVHHYSYSVSISLGKAFTNPLPQTFLVITVKATFCKTGVFQTILSGIENSPSGPTSFYLKADGKDNTGSCLKSGTLQIVPNIGNSLLAFNTGWAVGPPGPNNGAGCGALPQPENCYPIE